MSNFWKARFRLKNDKIEYVAAKKVHLLSNNYLGQKTFKIQRIHEVTTALKKKELNALL